MSNGANASNNGADGSSTSPQLVFAAPPATCERRPKCDQPEQTTFVYCPHCMGVFCLLHSNAHIYYCEWAQKQKKERAG